MKVKVSLHSIQRVDGETDEISLEAVGTWDGTRLQYTEPSQDGAPGAEVTVTVRDEQIVIERRSETVSQMILEQGRRHLCRYDTPYGRLTLHTQTHRTEVSFVGGNGFLQAAYTLDMNGATTEQEIEIGIKEVSLC